MDFLNGRIKTIYFRYLSAAFGSALITSIYSIVDMAMVGQYHGPEGSAALAVVAPVWNIIYSFGLLMGIGGSVIFSTIRGKEDGDIRRSNEYFTASVIGAVILSVGIWLVSGNKRTVGLRSYCQYQHLCAVLRIQCGTGVSADYFHQFRRRKRRQDPGDAEIRSWNGGGIQCLLDSLKHAHTGCIYPAVYEPHRGSP